jgi:hypothetical protein
MFIACSTNDDNDDVEVDKSPTLVVSITLGDEFPREFHVNSEFPENAKLTVNYEDKTSTDIYVTESMVSGFDTSKTGDIILEIMFALHTISVPVSITNPIIEIELPEDFKKTYNVGEQFGTADLIITFASGRTEKIALDVTMVENFNSSTANTITLKITYAGFTISEEIEIVEDTPGTP